MLFPPLARATHALPAWHTRGRSPLAAAWPARLYTPRPPISKVLPAAAPTAGATGRVFRLASRRSKPH